MHAELKARQGIRGTRDEHEAASKDALADIMIYLCDYATCGGGSLSSVVANLPVAFEVDDSCERRQCAGCDRKSFERYLESVPRSQFENRRTGRRLR